MNRAQFAARLEAMVIALTLGRSGIDPFTRKESPEL
jgi:hypothetical protein